MRAVSLTAWVLKVRSLAILYYDTDHIWDTKPSIPKIETFYLYLGNDNDAKTLEADEIKTTFFEGAERHQCWNKTRESETSSTQDYMNQQDSPEMLGSSRQGKKKKSK